MDEHIDVNARLKELEEIQNYLRSVNSNVTMILQSVNWDRNHLQNSNSLNTCKVDFNHRVPRNKLLQHENLCKLSHEGYLKDTILLPECSAKGQSTIKLTTEKISEIIEVASKHNPTFKRGNNGDSTIPNSASRLFSAHTADERKAIYDHAVSKTLVRKECMDGLVLNPENEHSHETTKSSEELLALARDMKRRRVKYKVSTKSKNYTHILKEVIENQMMMFKDCLNSKKDNSHMDSSQSTLYYKSSPSSSIKVHKKKHMYQKPRHESREKYAYHSEHDQKSTNRHNDGKSKHEYYKNRDEESNKRDYSKKRHERRERSNSGHKHKLDLKSHDMSNNKRRCDESYYRSKIKSNNKQSNSS